MLKNSFIYLIGSDSSVLWKSWSGSCVCMYGFTANFSLLISLGDGYYLPSKSDSSSLVKCRGRYSRWPTDYDRRTLKLSVVITSHISISQLPFSKANSSSFQIIMVAVEILQTCMCAISICISVSVDNHKQICRTNRCYRINENNYYHNYYCCYYHCYNYHHYHYYYYHEDNTADSDLWSVETPLHPSE